MMQHQHLYRHLQSQMTHLTAVLMFILSLCFCFTNAGWKLTLADEFNNQIGLDSTIWNTFYHYLPVVANSMSYPTPDAFTFTPQFIRLLLERRNFTAGQYGYFKTYQYTSATLTTKNKFSQTYGYFEINARMPRGKGFWPAFWFIPQDLIDGGKFTVDVVEYINQYPYQTIQCYNGTQVHYWDTQSITDGAFHTYGLQWSPGMFNFYIDGVSTLNTTQCVPNEPMYVLITCGIGGSRPGPPDGSTPFPNSFDIDYFRAYQYVSSGGISLVGPGDGIAFSNPAIKPSPPYDISNPKVCPELATPGSPLNATVTLKLGQQGGLTNGIFRAQLFSLTTGNMIGNKTSVFSLGAGGTQNFTWIFTLPSTLANGYYYLTLGLFNATWHNIYWQNTAAMFGIGSVVGLSSRQYSNPAEVVLRVSENEYRGSSIDLSGTILSGKVYIFASSITVKAIQQVVFYQIDSSDLVHTIDQVAPYDFNGENDTITDALDVHNLSYEDHFIKAVATFTDGTSYTVTSTFRAGNPNVIPILDCIKYVGGNQYSAYLGYSNENEFSLSVLVGSSNQITPSPENRGQTTEFGSKRSDSYPLSPFVLNMTYNEDLTWKLGDYYLEIIPSNMNLRCPNESIIEIVATFNSTINETTLVLFAEKVADAMAVNSSQVVILGYNETSPFTYSITLTIVDGERYDSREALRLLLDQYKSNPSSLEKDIRKDVPEIQNIVKIQIIPLPTEQRGIVPHFPLGAPQSSTSVFGLQNWLLCLPIFFVLIVLL